MGLASITIDTIKHYKVAFHSWFTVGIDSRWFKSSFAADSVSSGG